MPAFDQKLDFANVWDAMISWYQSILDVFSVFFDWASTPLIPDGKFKDALELVTGWSNWIGNLLLSELTDGRINSLYDVTLFDLLVPLVFVVVIYTFVKWVLDIVL